MSVESYYDAYWTTKGFRPTGRLTEPQRRLFERYVRAGDDCLDVGCGDGRTSGAWLRERGANYVGVDISASGVEEARSLGLDARRIEDAGELPFEAASFDVVLCIEVLEHLFAPQDAVAEIHRVLRPGGKAIVTVPNAAYWRRRADLVVLGRWNPLGDDLSVDEPWRDPHIRFFTPRVLGRLLESAGLEVVESGGHGGTLLGDIPKARSLCRRRGGWAVEDWTPNPLYGWLERAAPGLLGYRLHAVARKPS